jgi:hypothetical protein
MSAFPRAAALALSNICLLALFLPVVVNAAFINFGNCLSESTIRSEVFSEQSSHPLPRQQTGC